LNTRILCKFVFNGSYQAPVMGEFYVSLYSMDLTKHLLWDASHWQLLSHNVTNLHRIRPWQVLGKIYWIQTYIEFAHNRCLVRSIKYFIENYNVSCQIQQRPHIAQCYQKYIFYSSTLSKTDELLWQLDNNFVLSYTFRKILIIVGWYMLLLWLRRKRKDLLAGNQDNVFEWGDMSIHEMLLQSATYI
jgi:hypothetical protein